MPMNKLMRKYMYGLYQSLLMISLALIFFTKPIKFIPDSFLITGFLLALTGAIIYVYWERLWLKNSKKGLITKGIYSHIRHPVLSAWILIFLGMAISFNSLQALTISILAVILIFIGSKKEEDYLIKEYGKMYKWYMKNVPYRFIPKVI